MKMSFSKADQSDRVRFEIESPLANADLAATIALVGNAWSMLEAVIGYYLGVVMNAEPKAAVALLSRINTVPSKIQAIEAVAKATITAAEIADLRVAMKSYQALATERNKIAHSMWGTIDSDPSVLVAAPPVILASASLHLTGQDLSETEFAVFIEQLWNEIEIYDDARLARIIASIEELTKKILSATSHMVVARLITQAVKADQAERP